MSYKLLNKIKAGCPEYTEIRIYPNNKIYAVQRMIFTTGLFVNLNEYGYSGRYCYNKYSEAVEAFNSWDGIGYPPGNWIKYKGEIEIPNPNYTKDE